MGPAIRALHVKLGLEDPLLAPSMKGVGVPFFIQGCTRTGPEPAKRHDTGTPMDNVERHAKSLASERADPKRNDGLDQTGPEQNANDVSSAHPCQNAFAMEKCTFPSDLEPSGFSEVRS